jgi:hypothetical protein
MKRNTEESYEAFKARRLAENQRVKQLLRGRLIHTSKVYYEDPDGKIQVRSSTYRRPDHV